MMFKSSGEPTVFVYGVLGFNTDRSNTWYLRQQLLSGSIPMHIGPRCRYSR
jgi:hypothetical protein